jgi:hypothetical protein
MKIRYLVAVTTPSYQAGPAGKVRSDLPEKVAADLVRRGFAEKVEPKTKKDERKKGK